MESLTVKKLDDFLSKRKCTLLGVGPMSKNCIDASIEISNEHNIPLMLIASRRQIDSNESGGGYVNNWTTEKFSEYVKICDKNKNIILCRDHGGPWQNDYEKNNKLNFHEAMESAKKSFAVDIKSNFQIIHIDPTIDIHTKISTEQIFERIFDLYEYCNTTSKKLNKKIVFEISLGKEDGGFDKYEEIKQIVSKMESFCRNGDFPLPYFLVVRTGNYVMELKNVGSFESTFLDTNQASSKTNLLKIIEFCNKHQIRIKEHNTDYLSDRALQLHPEIGIHAANIAPEFAVAETRAFLSLLKKYQLEKELEKFIEISYSSKKWEKWMLSDSKLGKQEKAIISGHYIFGKNEFIDLKNDVERKVSLKGTLDSYLKLEVKKSIIRYLNLFSMI